MPDSLDEALGIGGDLNALPSVHVMPPGAGRDVIEAEDDHEFARRNVRDAISTSREALEVAIDVVTTSGAAKEVEALANLLDKFVQANERLVAITEKPRTKNGEDQAKVVNNTQNVMIVGTTDDLLKAVRKARGERDEEDFLQR